MGSGTEVPAVECLGCQRERERLRGGRGEVEGKEPHPLMVG